MFKRVIWFAAGAAAGVAGVRKAEKVVVERMERYSPPALASSLGDAAKGGIAGVRDAVRDGRREMHRVSARLEAEHDPARHRRNRSSAPHTPR
jgi:ribosomal protein L15E